MMRGLLIASLVVTVAAIVLWLATGGDAYTKYRVIETAAREVAPDDPLAAAGFYEEDATATTSRDEFRFGLLPTPQGLFDKHVVSVATFAGPMWALTIAAFVWSRRRAPG